MTDRAGGDEALVDGPCFYCGEMTSSFAGDPGQWPLQFCQPDGTGVCRFHHTRCVTSRLAAPPQPAPDALRDEAQQLVTEWLGMFDPPPQIDFQQSEFLQQAIASALGIARTGKSLSTPLPSGEYPNAPRSALEQIRDAEPPEGGLMRGVDIWQAAFEELQRQAAEALASHDGECP